MKKLYFTRHGLSVMNQQGLRSGSTNTPLTDEGRLHAQKIGRETTLHFDLIVTSALDRAIETAEIIAREVGYPIEKIEKSPLLNERDFGALEAQPYTPDADTDDVDGIELEADMMKRARAALNLIESLPGDVVLIVAHGAIGRALRHVANPDIPYKGAGHFPNTHIVELAQK